MNGKPEDRVIYRIQLTVTCRLSSSQRRKQLLNAREIRQVGLVKRLAVGSCIAYRFLTVSLSNGPGEHIRRLTRADSLDLETV